MSRFNPDYTLDYSDMAVLTNTINGEHKTPIKIANAIVESLDDWTNGDIFKNPNYHFLDIYSKSGIFLALIYNKLMRGLAEVVESLEDRSQWILSKMLYGISPSIDAALVTRKTIYSDFLNMGNIIQLHGLNGLKGTELSERAKGALKDMKFDVVIGNPPYNRGMDIDFVNLGYELSNKFTCMITPAKWQTAEADQKIASKMSYGEFRKKLVPHMSHVVFYPDCLDVFGISESSGISYFLIDRQKEDADCSIENRCNLQKYVNGISVRSLLNRESLWNIGNKIVNYIRPYNTYKIENIHELKKYTININTQMTKSTGSSGVWDWERGGIKPEYIGHGGVLFGQEGNLVLTGGPKILVNGSGKTSTDSRNIFTSDSVEECKSFYSWLDTKFTRFFILITLSTMRIINNNSFRFVPEPTVLDTNGNRVPGKFDHIYTDEELYKTFNLPQEYIDVIEAVIKERK